MEQFALKRLTVSQQPLVFSIVLAVTILAIQVNYVKNASLEVGETIGEGAGPARCPKSIMLRLLQHPVQIRNAPKVLASVPIFGMYSEKIVKNVR
jgi:hypothetical protein|tara:strand:- start:200 stop:484 length:285 start_codon:yes stop_codon:yes gene_type:complete